MNRRVSAEARRRRLPVNVADSPEECTFLLPAVVRGDGFTAAISTGGKNPGAAKALREFLEEHRRRSRSASSGGDAGSGSRRGRERSTSSAPDRATPTCSPCARWDCCGARTRSFTIISSRGDPRAGARESRADLLRPARQNRRARGGPEAERDPRGDGPAGARGEIRRPPQVRRPARVRTGRRGGGTPFTGRDPLRDRAGDHRSGGVRGGGGHSVNAPGQILFHHLRRRPRDRRKGGKRRRLGPLPKDGTLAVYMGVGRVEAIARELAGRGFRPKPRSPSWRTGTGRNSASFGGPCPTCPGSRESGPLPGHPVRGALRRGIAIRKHGRPPMNCRAGFDA